MIDTKIKIKLNKLKKKKHYDFSYYLSTSK